MQLRPLSPAPSLLQSCSLGHGALVQGDPAISQGSSMVGEGVAWDLGIWWHDPREGTVNLLHGTATVPSHHAESQLGLLSPPPEQWGCDPGAHNTKSP